MFSQQISTSAIKWNIRKIKVR